MLMWLSPFKCQVYKGGDGKGLGQEIIVLHYDALQLYFRIYTYIKKTF